MENLDIDIQCRQILEGIENLENLLQDPLAKEALALSDNLETNRNKDLLFRLKQSLIQYVERGKDLFYVGFMGHFSTGKSSSINSLLSLEEDSDNSRRVGLNPVDKSITLISHKDNQDVVFNSTKGGLVSIVTEYIDNAFLKEIVIADTPGVGDPVLASEITKDFLPICDLIIYFFSATNPLDSSDVPLLREKQSQLPFIPIKFVVTRADEFRKDSDSPLDIENFDRFESANFVETLIYRLNGLLQYEKSVISAQDVFLIDNKAKFNVQELEKLIVSRSDTSSAKNKIVLHSHKVQYFKSSAESLRSFFSDFILKKVVVISDIVKTAEDNIDRFQHTIRVTNSGLTKSWSEKLENIDSIGTQIAKDMSAHALPVSLSKVAQHSLRYNRKLQEKILQKSEVKNSEVREALIKEMQDCLQLDMQDLNRKISSFSFRDVNGSHYIEFEARHFYERNMVDNLTLKPTKDIQEEAEAEWESINSAASKIYSDLKKMLRELHKSLSEQKPLRAYERHINSASESLLNDFDNFFESIRVYRSGVFSMGTKSAISTLGLGGKLDLLELNRLTEEAEKARKYEAEEHVFPGKTMAFSQFSKDFSELSVRCKDILHRTDSLNSQKTNKPKMPEPSWIESAESAEKNRLADRIQAKISDFERSINIELRNLSAKMFDEWKFEISYKKTKRRNNFLIAAGISTLIGTFGCFLFLEFRNINLSNNVWITLIFGILVNLLTNSIGALSVRLTNNLPKLFSRKEKELLDKFYLDSKKIIDRNASKLDSLLAHDYNFHYDFWKSVLLDKPIQQWEEDNSAFYQELKVLSEEYNDAYQRYIDFVQESSIIARRYFSNPESNLEKLQEISDSLKMTAIEPSFNLLAETKKELETVNNRMQTVTFS